MNNDVVIIIPAIIDEECAIRTSSTISKNIVSVNPDFRFNIILNIDDYKRSGCLGNVESISQYYLKIQENNNCDVAISVHKKPLGLTFATLFLFNKFLEAQSNLMLFLDDDCDIINPVILSEFYDKIDENSVFHLAFGYDNKSSENPFIKNDIYFDGNSIRMFKNNRNFCTENGTFLTRKLVLDILGEGGFDRNINAEDNIGRKKCYGNRSVYTVAFKKNECVVNLEKSIWRLPKENHFIIDSIRHYRKWGWDK